jgi:diphosphomevalonate decarboxylase
VNKATAEAPSNLAFVKYWGRKDEELRLPTNANVSVCLDGMTTITTVEFDEMLEVDTLEVTGVIQEGRSLEKASKHLDRIRKLAGIDTRARIVSKNSFPSGTGLSSSASGFAALTVAGAAAAGLGLSEIELSILARQGSGSACRSIPDGYSEWLDGDTSDNSYAISIFPADHWDLSFVVGVVSDKPKHVSTSDGQKAARTSPFFEARLAHMSEKVQQAKQLIKAKEFTAFGELAEAEALELHTIMLTQKPALIYWSQGTLALMQLCQKWRETGELESYFSVNTGQDIYFIVRRVDELKLTQKLNETGIVKDIIINHPGHGAKVINEHLF